MRKRSINILTIVGARPQFIKAAALSRKLPTYISEKIVHTGQHYDLNMSDIFFDELAIPKPAFSLNIGSASHGKQTGMMLEKLEALYIEEKPDAVIVYGDTNSTLAGALAASKLDIPVFHIEAGLRSYNKHMPEEQNRIIVDNLSALLFCPTHNSVENLKKEYLTNGVYDVGDIMYDSILNNYESAKVKYCKAWIDSLCPIQGTLKDEPFILCTIHRAESTNNTENLKNILGALNEFGSTVILPVHPRTKQSAYDIVRKYGYNNIILVEPVNYLLMIYLVAISSQVVTDSGGLQKEAFFLGVPCTTTRLETEWTDTLSENKNILVGYDKSKIIQSLALDRKKWEPNNTPFGNGHSAEKIIEVISEWINNQ